MLSLGLSGLAALSIRGQGFRFGGIEFALCLATSWILFRIATTDVLDDARADLLLASSLLASAWITVRLASRPTGLRVLMIGLSGCVLGNVIVAVLQSQQPEFTWPYASRPSLNPSGFFGHYNYFANFVVGAGLLAGARAIFAKVGPWERTLHAATFAMACLGVWLSGSRGGMVALAAGLFVGLAATALWAWRIKSRWLPVFALAIPLLLVGGIMLGGKLLSEVQERRTGGEFEIAEFADNISRLNWYQLAGRVVIKDPWLGGGSRSFAWRRNQEWNREDFGWAGENEPFVHNEILQTATDYGLVGAGLILIVLVLLLWSCIQSLVLGNSREGDLERDWLRIGVLAALSAMLVQANVSFVFHLLPSTMLLGVFVGLVLAMRTPAKSKNAVLARVGPIVGLVLSLPLIWFGGRATLALKLVWPVLYAKETLASQDGSMAFNHLSRAAEVWPGFQMLSEKATLARQLAARASSDPEEAKAWFETAAQAYLRSLEVHPNNAVAAVNLANTYSLLRRDAEAESQFRRAREVQGNLEPTFFAMLYHAKHLHTLWYRRWTMDRRAGEALWGFRRALSLLDEADQQTPPYLRNKELRKSLEDSINFLEGAGVTPKEPGD